MTGISRQPSGRGRLRYPVRLFGVCVLSGVALSAVPSGAPNPATSPSPQAASAATEQPTFAIREFRVLGNTLLDRRRVEAAVYPFLGPNKSLQDVEQARDALAAVYRQAGYGTVFVDIPQQTVDSGIVRLRVTEGRLQRANISGARYFSEAHVLEQLPALKPGVVPNLPVLQLQLGRLGQEARDRQVTPILRAGSETGTVVVDLKVQDRLPLHFSLEVDDRHTAGTTPVRATGIVSYENMFQRAETLSLQYETAPARPSQVELLAVTYQGRTANPDLTWAVYGIRSKSDVAAVGTLSVLGNGSIAGGRLNIALTARPQWSDAVSLGVDYKDFRQQVNELTGATETPVHYFVWSGSYSAVAHASHLDFSGSLAINFGVQGLGNPDQEFEYNRYGARGDFFYIRGSDALVLHGWHGSAARVRLGYQYSDTPLVNNEQISVGGFDSVRGYLEAEALTDSAVLESIELSPPPLKVHSSNSALFAFYDAGQGGIQQPLPAQQSHFNLAGTGLGVRTSWLRGLDSSIDGAVALKSGPSTHRYEKRVEFTVTYAY